MVRLLLILSTALILLFFPLRPVLAEITNGDILFIDDFSSGSLGSWIIETGNWHIQNGQLVGSGYGRALGGRTGTGSNEWDNYIYEIDVLNKNGIDEGIGFRRSPDGGSNSYEVIVRHGTGNYNTPEIILAKVEDSQLHILYDTHNIPLVNDQTYHFKFSAEGEHLQGWVNDLLIYDLVDSGTKVKKGPISLSYNSGDFGIAEVYFDNVKVTSLNPSTSPSPSISPTPSPTDKIPLIFVPGIAGSELKVTADTSWNEVDGHDGFYKHLYPKDEIVWLNGTEAAKLGNDDYFDILKMSPNGQTSLAPIAPTGNTLSIYDPTIDYFTERGYVLGEDFFIFGYDWRQDLSLTSNDLEQFINQVKQKTFAPKVDLLTHSMGGLVAKKYIDNPTNAQSVNKFIALAPPFLGSNESLKNLYSGSCLTLDLLKKSPVCIGISKNEAKDVYQNWISGFQLLPSKKYYDFYNGQNINPVPFKDERDMDNNSVSGNLNYDQTKQLLTNLGYNTALYNPAESFHQIDNNLSNTNGVDTTIIVGSGKPTLGQIIEKYKYDFFGNKIETKDEILINGDATVPLYSASLNDSERNFSLFDKNKVFYVNDTHGGVATNESVLGFAKNLLDNNPLILDGISQTPTKLNGSWFSVHSPVLIHAYDALGNHTGPKADGDFETNIPGSSYETLDDAKFIFLPEKGIYQFKFEATGQGQFDFKIREFTENQNNKTTIYKDVPLTRETKAQVFIDNNTSTSPNLIVDIDGNGINDKQFSPTTISENKTTDLTPPKTKLDISGEKGLNGWYTSDVKINLEGIDEKDGSGVSKIEYSLDNGLTINQYKTPFTISKTGINNLRIKTTDQAGNEEPLQVFEIKIDKSAPEIKVIFNLNTQDFDFIGLDDLTKAKIIDNGNIITTSDEAGNTTKLTLTSKENPRREKVSLKLISYNNQKPIDLTDNLLAISYQLDKKKLLTDLSQRVVVKGEEHLKSEYDPKKDLTKITIKKPKVKKNYEDKAGKILLFATTNKGNIEASY